MSKLTTKKAPSAYAKAGVDIEKADQFVEKISKHVKATFAPHATNIVKSIGGYAALYDIGGNQYIAATTDGVGTKLKLAFETKCHNTVGIDLVAMSVNDLICVGARPLFFLDYFATGKLDLKTSESVIQGIVEGCRQAKLALLGGETAEMPGIYQLGEYDLAGFAVGIVNKEQLLDGSKVKAGDVLLGIESSGPHSNGFSLIRKLIEKKTKNQKLLKACFEPTRIYVSAIEALVREVGPQLKGLAHITGSGFLNIPRIHENFDYSIVLPPSFEIPEVFQELKTLGKLSYEEMFTTFNMGIGMVVAVEPVLAVRAQRTLSRAGFATHMIGQVQARTQSKHSTVRVRGEDFEIALSYT